MITRRISLGLALMLLGLSAGFFFTYEASVTLGLAEVDDVTYVKTFQAINATIRNFWFGLVFFGSVPALGFALAAHRKAKIEIKVLLTAALILYLGCIAITMAGNVPLNDQLALVSSPTPDIAAVARAEFEADWNQLNLSRTLAVIAGFGCLVAASLAPPNLKGQSSLDESCDLATVI